MCRIVCAALLCLLFTESLTAQQLISFRSADYARPLIGRHFATDVAGSVVIQTSDGQLHSLAASAVSPVAVDANEFAPDSAERVGQDLQRKLGSQFSIYRTQHFVIVHESSREFAKWCAMFVERLHRTYHAFWRNQGLGLENPEFPLVVVVYKDRLSFERHCRSEAGTGVSGILGYYSQHSNLVHVYDMTPAIDKTMTASRWSPAVLNHRLGERQIATLVHEAAHQLACNTGLQTRLAPYPTWLSEGLALFFETPDLAHQKGWSGIGAIHRQKLADYLVAKRDGLQVSWKEVVEGDEHFTDGNSALAAYSQSWLLTYYLYKKQRDAFVRYVQFMSELKPFDGQSQRQNSLEFFKVFKTDSETIEEDLDRFVVRLKN